MEPWVEALDALEGDALLVSLAWLAGRDVAVDDREANEALRRAVVVRAVGGDPTRELTLDEEAIVRLAAELDRADARAALRRGLEALRPSLAGRPAAAAVDALVADEALAWRCFAASRLADELLVAGAPDEPPTAPAAGLT
jgi:hypothetical protein